MVIVLVSSHDELLLCSFEANWSNRLCPIAWDIYISHVLTASMDTHSLSVSSVMKLMSRSDMWYITLCQVCSRVVHIDVFRISSSSILAMMYRWLLSRNLRMDIMIFPRIFILLIINDILFWSILLKNSLLLIGYLQRHMLFLHRRWPITLLWRYWAFCFLLIHKMAALLFIDLLRLFRVLWWNWLSVLILVFFANFNSAIFEVVISVVFLFSLFEFHGLPFGSICLW